MDGISSNDNIIGSYDSDIEFHQKGKFLGGKLKKNDGDKYFFRSNQRYTEVFAGLFGKNYGIGMDANILQYLLENEVEYIFIKTQYNLYEISTEYFMERMKEHPGIDDVYLCSELDFATQELEDSLDDSDDSEPDAENNDSDEAPKRLTEMAETPEELKEILEEKDGYYHESNIPVGKSTASNCIEYAIRAFKVNKKAIENGKNAEPIVKADAENKEKESKQDKEKEDKTDDIDTQNYSDGEQISMF